MTSDGSASGRPSGSGPVDWQPGREPASATTAPASRPPAPDPDDEPSEDDEDADDPRAGLTGDEAALALVREGLGGTVIETR